MNIKFKFQYSYFQTRKLVKNPNLAIIRRNIILAVAVI